MRRSSQFALKSVLDLRRHIEESAIRVVAGLRQAYQIHANHVARLDAEIERSLHAPFRGIDVASLLWAVDVHTAAMRETTDALECARRTAIDAARRRRSIEILLDRQAVAFVASERRAEDREIVELGALNKPRLMQFD